MKRFFLLIVFFIFCLAKPAFANETARVTKVVDGDTLSVTIGSQNETVRLLGIDTPETVDPRKPVQCFGKAASDKMKAFVAGKSVILIADPTQGNRDQYHRLLRYVYLPDNKKTFINGEMVKQGYAFSYRAYPTKLLSRFNAWEAYAKAYNLGLWRSCPESKVPVTSIPKPVTKTIAPTPTTYTGPVQSSASVSSTGDKDCKDFSTQAAAQAYFNARGGSATNNIDRLDGNDHDGIVCEALP